MLLDKDIMMDCYQKYGDQTKKQMKLEGVPRGCVSYHMENSRMIF